MLRNYFATRKHRNDIQRKLESAEDNLRIAAAIFDTLQGIIVTDAHGVILRVNAAFTHLSGYSVQELVGKTPRLLRSGHHDDGFYDAMRDSISKTGRWQGEIWDRRKDGGVFPKWMTITAVPDTQGNVTHLVATYIDITEQKRAEDKVNQLAFYDVLTQLPNRALLNERLQQALLASSRNDQFGAVLMLDLDHFKRINDSLGHNQGDILLQQASQRLLQQVPADSTVARIGGDEFAIVLTALGDSPQKAAAKAEVTGRHLLQTLAQPYLLDNAEYRCTASLGIVLFSAGQPNASEILKQAELAMYQAKHDGRNGLHFFDMALEESLNRRLYLERELDKALAADQFLLYYQPQITQDGRVYGAEALIRWQHPDKGLISPADFIPLAEENRQILAVGHWVLEAACTQLARWANVPLTASLVLAVNVSALQFQQENFVDDVLLVLEKTGINPGKLKLELTESLLVGNVDMVIGKMQALKQRGLQLSLDDFGTGYSSLSYLKRMPLDQLKIDQSFVGDLLEDTKAAAIARSIASLAENLGLMIVAEGIETAAQRDVLAQMGCMIYQGDHYSRPLPLADFERYMVQKSQPHP